MRRIRAAVRYRLFPCSPTADLPCSAAHGLTPGPLHRWVPNPANRRAIARVPLRETSFQSLVLTLKAADPLLGSLANSQKRSLNPEADRDPPEEPSPCDRSVGLYYHPGPAGRVRQRSEEQESLFEEKPACF